MMQSCSASESFPDHRDCNGGPTPPDFAITSPAGTPRAGKRLRIAADSFGTSLIPPPPRNAIGATSGRYQIITNRAKIGKFCRTMQYAIAGISVITPRSGGEPRDRTTPSLPACERRSGGGNTMGIHGRTIRETAHLQRKHGCISTKLIGNQYTPYRIKLLAWPVEGAWIGKLTDVNRNRDKIVQNVVVIYRRDG